MSGPALPPSEGYLEVVRALRRPTDVQTDCFARYVSAAHSWYKHLPLAPWVPFFLFLDPNAGMSLSYTPGPDGSFTCHKKTVPSRTLSMAWPKNLAVVGCARGRHIPDPDGAVHAGRGNSLAVRAEDHVRDSLQVAAEGVPFLAGVRVPQLDAPVRAGRGQPPAVGAERHACQRARMPAA
jgi:hypothetical protein